MFEYFTDFGEFYLDGSFQPIMLSTPHLPQRQPQYPNEDTSPTTERELRGWYSYSIAAEVFAVCGVGTYIPFPTSRQFMDYGEILIPPLN